MSKLLDFVLGFFGVSGHQLIIIAALVAAAFFGGAAWQNGNATVAAVEAVQKAADARAGQDRAAYAAKIKQAQVAQDTQRQRQMGADQSSHDQLVHERDAAQAAYERAMAQLKEKPNAAYPSDALVIGDADLRRLFDDAAGACTDAGSVPPAADVRTGTDDRPAACGTAADIRLGDLKAGYLALGKSYRDTRGQLLAAQTQARALGLAPTAISGFPDK